MNSELEIKQEATPSTEQAAGPDETSNSVSSIPNLLHDGDDHAAAFHSSRELVEDHSGPQQQHQQHEPLPTAEDAANAADNNGGSTMYKYRDFGHVEDDGEDAGSEEIPLPTSSSNRNSSESSIRVQKFPVKLYAILAQKEFQDIICWMPHGRSWKVLKPSMFESLVMPLFFEYSNYHSFNRLVNAWSFRRISTGPDRGSYYHELFLRGKPHLQKYMRRLPKTHKKLPMKKKDEPDFYKLDQTNPLPEVHEAPVPGAAATVQAMRNGPVTPTNPGMSPMSHHQGGSNVGNSSSSIVTPTISPYHSQNIIGGPHHGTMMHGSPNGGNMNGMNNVGNMSSGYMGSTNMNNMGFMSSGGSNMNGGMMSMNGGAGGFNSQGNMGMMGGGHSGSMGNNMMMGMGGPMSNSGGNPNGMSSMGGSGSMSPMGRGNSSSMNSNARYSSYNDMGSQDEYDMPLMGAGGPQMAFSPMGHNTNTSSVHGNNGYGSSNGGYIGGGSQSYNSVPPSPAPNNMRRTMPMRQAGMDSPHIMGSDQQHMTPQHQQQYMTDMYVPQGQSQMSPPMHMQDMMQQQPLHSQQNMYNGGSGGGRSSSSVGGGSPSVSQQQQQHQQHQQDQQDDYHGSGSSNVSQQQQQQRASPPRATA